MWDQNAGLFTQIASGATVSNLTLANESITNTNSGYQTNVGGVAGINNGLISNVVVSGGSIIGQPTSGSAGGGIVGSNSGSLVACTVSGVAVSETYAGGFAGINQGAISGGAALDVTASGSMDVGGIAGFNSGTITASTASGGSISGGLVGGIAGFNKSSCTISAVSSTAISVTGMNAGGLVGKNEGLVSNGYISGGAINGFGSDIYAGGAIGYNLGDLNMVAVSAVQIVGRSSGQMLCIGGVVGTPASRYTSSDTRIFAPTGFVQLDYTSGGNIVVGITGNSNMIVQQTAESSLTFGPTLVTGIAGCITVNAPGSNVFQTGAIAAPAVVLDTGNGNITLTNESNQIDALQIISAAVVNVFDSEDIILGIGSVPINVKSIGVTATGNVILSTGLQINASTFGNAIVLASIDKHFYNTEGSDALNAANGSWLVYSKSPTSDIVNGLPYDFVQYNTTLGSVITGSGNGLIYSCSPQLSGSLGGYAIKKVNGTTEVSNPEKLKANISSGAIHGDSVAVDVLGAIYDTPDVGAYKMVTLTTGRVTAYDINSKPVYGYTVAPGGVTGSVGVIYGQDVFQPIIAIQAALLTQTENQTRAGKTTDSKQLLDEQAHKVGDSNSSIAQLQSLLKLDGDSEGNVLALPMDVER